MGNEFWAAVWGAVVGGAIGLAGQVLALVIQARNRAADQKAVDKGRGMSLLYKMLRIHNDLHHLRAYLEEAFSNAANFPAGARPWQYVRPLANLVDLVTFSADEFAFALGLKDDGLLKELLGIDEIHNSTVDLFATYNALRSSLAAELSAEMDGIVGTTTLNAAQMLVFGPKMAGLDDLLLALRPRCEKDERQARRALLGLQAALHRSDLGITHKIVIEQR